MASAVTRQGITAARRWSSGLLVGLVRTVSPVFSPSPTWSRATAAICSGVPETRTRMPNSAPRTAIRLSSTLAPRSVRYSVTSATRPGRSGPRAESTRKVSVFMAGILPGPRLRSTRLELGVDEAEHVVAMGRDIELVAEGGLDAGRTGGRSGWPDQVGDPVG